MKHLSKLLFALICVALLVTSSLYANQYRSRTTPANWNVAATWDSSGDGGATWIQSTTTIPGALASDTVLIRDGHTITINANFTISKLNVGEIGSGILIFDGTARTVTISGDVSVATGGTFITQAATSATHTMTIGGDLTNNGKFDMSRGGSTLICNVTFNKAGTQNISGSGADTTRFRAITLSKTAQANKMFVTITVYIGGACSFTTGTWEQNTGKLIIYSNSQTIGAAAAWIFSGSGGMRYLASGSPLNNGIFTMNTTDSVVFGVGNNSFQEGAGSTTTLTSGVLAIGGRLTLAGAGATNTINGAKIIIDPQGSFVPGVAASNLSVSSNAFECSGTANLTFSSGSVTLINPNAAATSGRDLKISSTGTVNMAGGTVYFGDGVATKTSSTVDGFLIGEATPAQVIGNIVLQTGGIAGRNVTCYNTPVAIGGDITLTSGQLKAFSSTLTLGNGLTITRSGGSIAFAPTFGTSVNVIYNAPSPAASITTGGELPTSSSVLNNLTINNSSGVTLNAAATVNGTLTLTSGNITAGSYTLSLGSSGGVARSSGHVIGNFKKSYSGSVSKAFEVGTANGYSPVTVDATGSGDFTVKAVEGAPSPPPSTNSLARYWELTNGGLTSANLTFQYLSGDPVGNESNYAAWRYSGGKWWKQSATVVPADDTARVNGVSAFSTWTLGECPAITVNPSSLPYGTVGIYYKQTVSASGGEPTYGYAVTSGSLPPGLFPNADSIYGTPTTGGNYNFDITATDTNGCTGVRSYSVTIGTCPTITLSPGSLPNGSEGSLYNQTISANGGNDPYTYAKTAGTIPSSLTLEGDGDLTGTPDGGSAGVYNFTVTATDSDGCTGDKGYTLVVCGPFSFLPTSLSNGNAGTFYSQVISASGGTALYSYLVTGGSLPAGLDLASGGTLSGTPTDTGTFNFTVTATDANGCTDSKSYSLQIDCGTITAGPPFMDGFIGEIYHDTINGSGGVPQYSMSKTGGTLPNGLIFSSNGALDGTPTVLGTFAFEITVTDSLGCVGLHQDTINIICPTITLTPSSLPTGMANVAYSQQITASGGTGPYQYTLTSGTLPANITLSLGGLLSGTTALTGSYPIDITATDANSCTGVKSYTLQINPAVATSVQNGNWSSGTTWDQGYKPLASQAAIVKHTVTLTAADTCQTVTVNNGGVLDLVSYKIGLAGTFTLDAGAEAKMSAYNPIPGGGGTPYSFDPASYYTFYGGSTGFTYTGTSITFGNVNWNATGNATPAVGMIIQSNLVKRGAGELRCGTGSPPTGLSRTIVVHGNVNIKAGVLVSNNATSPITGAIDIDGDLSVDSIGGVRGVNWTGDGTIKVGGNFVNSGTGQMVNIKPATPGATGNFTIYFKGTNTKTFTPGSNDSCRTFIVPVGKTVNVTTNGFDVQRSIVDSGALYLGTNIVKGAGNFLLAAGATLGIGDPAGITTSGATGNIQVAGTRTFDPAANYVYNGTVAQVTGNGFPAICNNLTINNPAGVTLSSNHAVDGVLTLTSGNVLTGIDLLEISSTGSVTRGGGGGHIIGNLQKWIATSTTTKTFETGDANYYAPVDLLFSTVNTAGKLTASTAGLEHPNIGTSGIDAAKMVNRYWKFTNNGVGFTTYNATFNFANPGDVDLGANMNNFIARKYDGAWSPLTVGNKTTTSTEITSATSFSDFTIGEPAPVLSNGTSGGDWSVGSTWLLGVVPSSTDSVVIQGTDSVYVLAAKTCAGLNVLAGGKLALNAKLTPTNVLLGGKIVIIADSLKPTGVMTVGGTGVFQHNRDGGKLPFATWNTGATLLITGVVGVAPTGGIQELQNITWNCPAQTGNVNIGWNSLANRDTTVTVNGDINVIATNAGRWQMTGAPAGSALAHTSVHINLNGNVYVSGGTFTITGSSGAYVDNTINHSGNITVTGGNFSISRGGQGGTGTSVWNLNSGDFSMSNATTQNSNTTPGGAKFVFKKSGKQVLTLDTLTNTLTALPIEVLSGTTLNMGVSKLKGSGNFTLNSGATLETANFGGLDSAVNVSGTKTLSAGANYTFNGTIPQITGSSLPSAVNNMTVSNTSGVTLSSNHTVNGIMTLTGGPVFTGVDSLLISSTGSVSRDTGRVVGNLNKYIASGATAKIFEIGDTTYYSPVDVQFANVTTPGQLTVSTTGEEHGQILTSDIDPLKSVNRYYTFTNNGVVFTNYDALFHFVSSDVDGGANTSNFIVFKYESPNWYSLTTGTQGLTSTQALGVTSVCDFAIGETKIISNTITATAGLHGTITPSGAVIVNVGEDTTFIFTPDPCYQVDSVYVDGGYIGAPSSYEFTNVIVPHTIHVLFKMQQFTLTVPIVGSGTVDKTPDKSLYDCGENVTLEATPSDLSWTFKDWTGDTSSTVNPIIIPMNAAKMITATFIQDSAYLYAYRSFMPESLALDRDNLGKLNKYVLRKPDKIDCIIEVVVDSMNITDLHIDFQNPVHTGFPFFTEPPSTITNTAGDRFNKKWDFVFEPPLNALDKVTVHVWAKSGRDQKVTKYYWTRSNVKKGRDKRDAIFTKKVYNYPMPNRVNALYETFYPVIWYGADGMVVGKNRKVGIDSSRYYAWMQTSRYADVMRTLIVSRTMQMHSLAARGFDVFNNLRVMSRKQSSLPPTKYDNRLLADMIALKLNIAASVAELTPEGFGELTYLAPPPDPIGFDGLMVKEIAEYGDNLMMGQYDPLTRKRSFAPVGEFADLAKTIENINKAFEGSIDTSSFVGLLRYTGVRPLKDVTFLRPSSTIPAVMIPIENTVSQEPLAYALYQNYPNPFNPTTTIQFDLPEEAIVTLKIYNMLGQEMATILDREDMNEGTQEVQFDAQNLSSGVYFYRIVAEGLDEDGAKMSTYQTVRKMILLK